MAVDTPARIAVLGAGPVGLEAALYGRYLGYEVRVYERQRVAGNVRKWGHLRLFSPFRMNCSPLGLAALSAQDPGWRAPDDDALLTGHEWIERYLQPLSRTDLLDGSIQEATEVVCVGREDYLKHELVPDAQRGDDVFRLLLSDSNGERCETADVVIDTTGTYGNHNWMGQGGIPALGERALSSRIEYLVPDALGYDRARYASRHTLLVGAGYSAATSIATLAELGKQAAGTRVTWVVRHELGANDVGPVRLVPQDRLPERDRVGRWANMLASSGGLVDFRPATSVQAIERDQASGRLAVELRGLHAGRLEVDEILANVGYRPDHRIYRELQVHECYASEGPMKLAAALADTASADCLDQQSHGPASLLNPEPNFYILGAKSYGRNSRFLVSIGLEQVRDVFTIIGDRADLDLYSTIGHLQS